MKNKFRAWDDGNKVMHYDFQFIKSGNDGNDWIIFTSDKQKLTDTLHPFNNPYFVQQLKIMPFVGVINGVEIYKDDLIQTDTNIQYVDYNESLMCWGTRHFSGGATMSFDSNSNVIGNVYQNPELIQ